MSTEGRQLYSLFERTWHWLQAAGILMLIVTGLAIHWPDRLGLVGFSTAVQIHNVLGLLLIANASLGLFYYVTTGAIRQYLPEPRDFLSLAVLQATYYVRGMLRGEPRPIARTSRKRLNPLQQITYLAVLNVLLPLQVLTGLLMLSAQQWPRAAGAAGGLPALAMIHTLGAWLLGAFLVGHLYLITTGHTPLAHLKAMVLGREDAAAGP